MTRGQDENLVLVVTDTHDIAEARDVLDGILASDRADTPAVTQRRNLDLQQPGQQPPQPQVKPRCEIPDWFEDLRAEVAAELAATRKEHLEATTRRQQHPGKLEAAQRQIDIARAAAAPFDNAIRRARQQRDAAEHDRRQSAQALAGAQRFARRPAREALAGAEQRLANAQARVQAALDEAGPAQRALAKADRAHDAIRDNDFYGTILDGWAHRTGRVEQLQQQQALAGWRSWATGEPVTVDQLATVARALHVDLFRIPYDNRYAALEDAINTWTSLRGIDISPPPAHGHEHARLEPSGLEVGI